MKEIYYVYKLSFGPMPQVQGAENTFDTLEEAKDFIKNPPNNLYGQAWLIVKKQVTVNKCEFIELVRIND